MGGASAGAVAAGAEEGDCISVVNSVRHSQKGAIHPIAGVPQDSGQTPIIPYSYKERAEKVSQALTLPVFRPLSNQRWRWALLPWVKLSGTTDRSEEHTS